MAGHTVRRQADPKTQLQCAGFGAGAAAIRRMLSTPIIRGAAAALLAFALMLIAEPVAGVGVTPAEAAKCKYSHRGPRKISRKHARQAVICQINKKRRAHGMRGLNSKRSLKRSGKRHSKYMRGHGCFAHQCSGEADLVRRVENTRYLPCNCSWRLGENLAWGQGGSGTPRHIVRSWMQSPPHRQVLLDSRLEHVGVGLVWGSPGNRNARAATYTADFGFKGG